MQSAHQSEPTGQRTLVTDQPVVLDLARLILKTINAPNVRTRIPKKVLPTVIGISWAHVNAILNPETQGLTKISLHEIGKVVIFARDFAAKSQDQDLRATINRYCNRIAQQIHEAFEQDGLSPTEFSFVANLRLRDGEKQQDFSDYHAGVHALIRLDRDGHILISRLDIFPREQQLCRFATDSDHSETGEPAVEGYIFSIGDYIQAVGRGTGSGLRTSILRPNYLQKARHDLIGLRLGVSNFDGGAYAYRIYCRRIEDADKVKQALPEWAGLFLARRFEAIEDLEERIPDIKAILKLLSEPDDKETPWGVRIPTGIKFDDDGA